MTREPLTKREKSVRRHNIASLLALVSFGWITIANFTVGNAQNSFGVAAVLVLFMSIIVMYATRNADEYNAAIWRASSGFAFVITTSLILFLPFLEGVYDGFMGKHNGQDIDLSPDVGMVLIGSFFIANGWTRIRGTM